MTIKVTIPNTSSDSLTFGSANTPTAAQVVGIDSGSSNGQLAFNTTASGTSTERMRIDASGNVGIGTSSPSYKLHVIGSTPSYIGNSATEGTQFGYASALPTNSVNCFVGWIPDTVGSAGINGDLALQPRTSAGGNIRFFTGSTSATERARIDSSGNLLVGTTTASGKIATTVGAGQVGYYTNKSSGGGGLDHAQYYTDGTLQGKITQTGGFTTVSDYRLKNDVVSLSGMLEKVCKLKPVSYTLTAFNQQQFGFIAHELQEEFPVFVDGEKDAVNEDGFIAPQSVDYPKLVSVLTAAIQEQQALITTLTERITALEAK